MTLRRGAFSLALVAIGAAACAGVPVPPSATQSAAGQAVRITAHFAFFSDFETNLNDALIAAGRARDNRGSAPSLEPACIKALPAAERAGWSRAVDQYAGTISSRSTGSRDQMRIRLELAGVVKDDEWEDPAERRFIEATRAIRAAAAPAYRACRWTAQDRANRRWIEALLPLLIEHESMLAGRLAEAFQTGWASLPIRVDVVETVDWTGANTIHLRPPSAHVLISSSNPGYQDAAALEMVFHEASHFLTGRDTPLRRALEDAVPRAAGNPFRGDLVHAVHFYMTGEIVRRRLHEAGIDYRPYMYAQRLYRGSVFFQAVESTWPAYLDGETTLPDAARALVQALQKTDGGKK